MSAPKITRFEISVPESALVDLKSRLAATRWPEKETVSDWSQGVPLSAIQEFCQYWHDEYDWRMCEKWINDAGSFKAEIDGYDIHFLHIRSAHENALPLLLLHGWPGSILEFRKIVDPLTDPTSYGGDAKDAFHLIIPTMPGYGFSSKPTATGTNFYRMSQLYVRLMEALDYKAWVAQGGDWGADICAVLAAKENNPPSSLLAIHLNFLYFDIDKELAASANQITSNQTHSQELELAISKSKEFLDDEYGYFKQQATRPQTIGYSLSDSPAGQAAWIYEKMHAWTDNPGSKFKFNFKSNTNTNRNSSPDQSTLASTSESESIPLTRTEILDNITLYWLTNTSASSARLYWEEKTDTTALPINIPIGITQFPGDHTYVPRQWAERYYSNIVHWSDAEKGGHFAAWEVPDLFVQELRQCFGRVRS